tara:strand:- start:190 stop:429 length:240 start_codon:yes stop_codon:yes gene_type:complete
VTDNANRLLVAARLKLVAELNESLTNLQVFLNNPTGVADHPNLTDQVLGFIREASAANDALAFLDGLIKNLTDPPSGTG